MRLVIVLVCAGVCGLCALSLRWSGDTLRATYGSARGADVLASFAALLGVAFVIEAVVGVATSNLP